MARAAKARGIKRFIFASTCSIYDLGFYAEDFLRDEDSEVRPRAAYAVSNYNAERLLLDDGRRRFCPVILRQGTVYGWSPRMRYDLVVNTFVRDALSKGYLTVNCGGEMWRPLVDVTDLARVYIACVEAPAEKVHGRIFNVVGKNYRILELAHWVREALKPLRKVEIEVDYSDHRTRSLPGERAADRDRAGRQVAWSASRSRSNTWCGCSSRTAGPMEAYHPRYYNIEWMTLLSSMEKTIKSIGGVF